eukprot:5174381-Prymnesium_polylepis.2
MPMGPSFLSTCTTCVSPSGSKDRTSGMRGVSAFDGSTPARTTKMRSVAPDVSASLHAVMWSSTTSPLIESMMSPRRTPALAAASTGTTASTCDAGGEQGTTS